ncbi:hypothetical protein V1477_019376 [Vespula maculifrons]|uniref:Uncharacterized protein n=1 Tax=Vespula maculifrons TaxID=7453 RepID=A0ABD2ASP7_VESMC
MGQFPKKMSIVFRNNIVRETFKTFKVLNTAKLRFSSLFPERIYSLFSSNLVFCNNIVVKNFERTLLERTER